MMERSWTGSTCSAWAPSSPARSSFFLRPSGRFRPEGLGTYGHYRAGALYG